MQQNLLTWRTLSLNSSVKCAGNYVMWTTIVHVTCSTTYLTLPPSSLLPLICNLDAKAISCAGSATRPGTAPRLTRSCTGPRTRGLNASCFKPAAVAKTAAEASERESCRASVWGPASSRARWLSQRRSWWRTSRQPPCRRAFMCGKMQVSNQPDALYTALELWGYNAAY